jgi:hypothetical protein
MADDDFHSNRFHWCALAAGFLAQQDGRLGDSLYVRELAYHFFETKAFADRVPHRGAHQIDIRRPVVKKTEV